MLSRVALSHHQGKASHLLIQQCGARFLPTALCETIYTVNKDRLGDFVRTCTDKEMEGVNAGILCSLSIAAPMVDGEPVGNSVTVERNLYKHLYEDLLNKVMAR